MNLQESPLSSVHASLQIGLIYSHTSGKKFTYERAVEKEPSFQPGPPTMYWPMVSQY